VLPGNTNEYLVATLSTTSLKLDRSVKERVQRIASARRRTPHWIMREAVEQYVEREEKREQLRRDALAAWADYQATGLHLTSEEADEWLSKLEAGKRAPVPKCHV
jgi:predicted transcriptional regulator